MTRNPGLRPQQILQPLCLVQLIADPGLRNTVPQREDVFTQSRFTHNQSLAGSLIGLLFALRYNRRLALFRNLTWLRRSLLLPHPG